MQALACIFCGRMKKRQKEEGVLKQSISRGSVLKHSFRLLIIPKLFKRLIWDTLSKFKYEQ